jgi:rare lipoprotein A (peptidoglycan hydrolase)
MIISKKTRLAAALVLAFMLMLMTSLFSTALKQKSVRKIEKKTILNERTKNITKKTEKKSNSKKSVQKNKPVKTEKITKTEKNDNCQKNQELIVVNTKQDSISNNNEIHHKATWYKTEGTRVHKEHPEIHGTAAYNFVPRGTRLLITNIDNNKSCVVEVTDRMGQQKKNYIDLSYKAFGTIANHAYGKIKVLVKIL